MDTDREKQVPVPTVVASVRLGKVDMHGCHACPCACAVCAVHVAIGEAACTAVTNYLGR